MQAISSHVIAIARNTEGKREIFRISSKPVQWNQMNWYDPITIGLKTEVYFIIWCCLHWNLSWTCFFPVRSPALFDWFSQYHPRSVNTSLRLTLVHTINFMFSSTSTTWHVNLFQSTSITVQENVLPPKSERKHSRVQLFCSNVKVKKGRNL